MTRLNPRHHPRIWVASVLAFLVVLYCGVSTYAASTLTKGTHEPITIAASSIGPVHDDIAFPSRVDHLTMRGWLFHATPSNGRSVIMVHGFKNNRVNTGYGASLVARDFIQHGYDVLLFDLRSCGQSDGSSFTLGKEEPRDLLGAYDFMRSRGYKPADMVVLGVSLGAATEIEAASQMPDVGAMVADSAFADLRPVLNDRLRKDSPLPAFFDWGIVTAATLFDDTNPDLRPVDAVRALPHRAFLFIQAKRDDWFPASNAEELYKASADPQSRLLIVDANGHVQEYLSGPSVYMAAVYSFIDAQIPAHGG